MCTNHHHTTPIKSANDKGHDDEHKNWSRRSFMQAMGIAGAGSLVLGNLTVNAAERSPLGAALDTLTNDRVLVIVRLKGGNDGLNTIVPVYDYGTYASQRPTIALPQSSLYNLDSNFGLPNFMSDLQSRWGNGEMKVVHGVGYDPQNLSHFRSSDIWATGDAINDEDTGILGRFFQNEYPNFLLNQPATPPAIQIGNTGDPLFRGLDTNYAFNVANPATLSNIAQTGTAYDVLNVPPCSYGEQLQFMRAVTNTTFNYAGIINTSFMSSTTQATYENNSFADQLSIVSRLIKGNLGTKIYMVSIGGFDTHANQTNNHANLMDRFSKALDAFYTDLAATGWDQNVVTMTVSEFGRRVEENGSQGTDHGAAAPAMVFGPALQGNGFVGTHPSMHVNDLDAAGNMVQNVDFRDLYSTMLKEWLCVDANTVDQVVLNGTYTSLPLGFQCNTVGFDDQTLAGFQHFPLYQDNRTLIHFTLNESKHLDITLYDIQGRQIATIANEFFFQGEHQLDVKELAAAHLFTGQYIYKINTGNQQYSKSIMIR